MNLTDYTVVELRPGQTLADLQAEIDAQREQKPISLDDVFARFDKRDFFTARPGLTVVIALGIYAAIPPEEFESVDYFQFQTAAVVLDRVLRMSEVCCRNSWCVDAATYHAIRRYDKEFGPPGWLKGW